MEIELISQGSAEKFEPNSLLGFLPQRNRDGAASAERVRTVMLVIVFRTQEHSIWPYLSDESGDSLDGVVWTVKKHRFVLPRLPT
jgi:hypothetical protein